MIVRATSCGRCAVVITHEHPDHCVDIYGLHVMLRYGLERTGLPASPLCTLAKLRHLGTRNAARCRSRSRGSTSAG